MNIGPWRPAGRLALLVAGVAVLGGCPADPGPEAEPAEVFEATLYPFGASGVSGTASLALGQSVLRASVSARGLVPGSSVPQHVLSSSDCRALGRSVLNLDAELSAPGEGALWGEYYPHADHAGVLDYEASRPAADLASALGEYRGTTLYELNLGARTVVLYDEDMRPVACGELVAMEWSAPGAS